MRTLDETLKNGIEGLHYGNRIILPFCCTILKAVVESDIITDFSNSSRGVNICRHPDYTDIYFLDYQSLQDVVTRFETIKMVIVEEGSDIFDFGTHRKLALHLKENHLVKIEEVNEDYLFIE